MVNNHGRERAPRSRKNTQGWSWWNLGFAHYAKNEYPEAFDYFKKSATFFAKNRDFQGQQQSLALLVVVTSDLELNRDAQTYLITLQNLQTQTRKRLPTTYIELAEAYLLKSSRRLVDKIKALGMFQLIDTSDLCSPYYTFFILFNKLELLTFELKTTGNPKVFTELQSGVNALSALAMTQNRLDLQLHSLLLQVKIALLKFDVTQAQKLLVKADQLVKHESLSMFSKIILYEFYNLFMEIIQGNCGFLNTQASIQDRIKELELETIIQHSLQFRLKAISDEMIANLRELEPFKEYVRTLKTSVKF